jgi:hypothetical protein
VFRTVSATGVNYRSSPLSAGAAGGIWDGIRLSQVELGGGEDRATENVEPLESLWWQAQCDGKAPSSGNDMTDEPRARELARFQAACDKLRPVREVRAA